MTGSRVVIIGAGVVGAAVADELVARGWNDVTVLEQGTLPAAGGSSSHAPGLVFQVNSSRTMTAMARYTVEKLTSLVAPDGPAFLQVGGLEVATTPERVAELHRRHGWLAGSGIEAHVLSAAECVSRYPLLDPAAVLAGLFVPTDGIAKAVRAVDAQLARARAGGARVLEGRRVLDVLTEDGRVSGVRTETGDVPADVVVCCAGIWGPTIAAHVGMDLPLTPLAHQLAWTTPLPTPAATPAASTDSTSPTGAGPEAVLPILRHQDQDLYFREDHDRLVMGFYGHRPMPVAPETIAVDDVNGVMPSVLAFTPEDFEEAWKQTQVLLPLTATASVEHGINGLFSFTTDNLPLIGQSPQVEGFWVAEAVWVTHSAGVGRAVAELLVDGHCSSFDLHACDVNRFEPHQLAPQYVRERDCQNFVEVYDIIHPLDPPEVCRPIRQSPFAARQVELGAVFGEANGWERPLWYEANAALVAGRDVPQPDAWAARHWSPIVVAEAQVTREAVALYDMTALKRLEVSGPGAVEFLQGMVTGDVAKSVGAITYCLLLDADGGIRSDVTVARLGPQHFQVGANGALDADWLTRHAPPGVAVRDLTAGTTCIGLWGPRARDVLAELTDEDVSNEGQKYFRGRRMHLGTVPVTALRLSYVGELGWELYTTADHGLRLWDLLWQAGARHGIIAAGRSAFTSLRLEKGYRAFGVDMTFEHDPYEAGLGFAVKEAKAEFIGRDAVLARKERTGRRLSCLTTGRDVVMGNEPVHAIGRPDGAAVGYVTSAAFGATIGCGIAYAWLPAELAEPGTSVQIGYFDRRIDAVVATEPLVDPQMSRLRG